ncbi:hypothetical protein [Natrinema sp. 1APR25-10V2]|uniref:DUF7344 domain-containing protein n=1 Tax=Natrinema sp. 1APR25-10V2 TaxID=2951081 RepID=UPI0028741113|nr:hypothetical protein [Natrinema sp. 1APR25-10V2]MDS0474482.1 hypothetical protein [Natrinema sp. 1APR25-10V2]
MGDERFAPDPFALRAAAGELPVDDVFRLLTDRHARYAIVYLHDHSTATLEELADIVTATDASVEGTLAGPADRDPIRTRLYHLTLPRLEELGFVAFDAERKVVTDADIPTAVTDAMGVTDRT